MADNIFGDIKKRVNLVDIVNEDHKLKGHGALYRGDSDDTSSLVVLRNRISGEWYYYWNHYQRGGDVFNYLMNERGMDKKSALEYAAGKAGIALPDWTNRETKTWLRVRASEDAFSIATRVFEKWMKATPAAMEYAHGRGWTDETIASARIGFSGSATPAEFKEMRETLATNNVDIESPVAVAIMGFKGDVAKLREKWERELELKDAITNEDVLNGYIPGFMSKTRLIYPHLYFQKVNYISARNLVWSDDKRLISDPSKNKSFNPRVSFVGERQPYFGYNYKAYDAPKVIIVEGPADVITLAQWGFNTFGQIGTYLDPYWAKELSERHSSIYYATDRDGAGKLAVVGKKGDYPIAELLGPLTQVVNWALKDTNDVRQWCVRRNISDEQQVEIITRRINRSLTVAELAARDAAQQQTRKDKSTEEKMSVMSRAFEIIAMMGRKRATHKLGDFIKLMKISVSDFNRGLKDALGDRGEETNDDSKPSETKFILGGWFPLEEGSNKGWLIDYLYNPQTARATFAYRDPEGRIGKAPHIDIKGIRYYPRMNDANITGGVIMFASDLGAEKPTRELLGWNELYMKRSFLLDNPLDYKLASYYAQFTWLHDCFDELAYLRTQGESDSGKSAIMLRIGYVSYRLFKTSGVGSAASLKYLQHIYRGSVFMDEVKDDMDEFDDRVVMLNIGAMKEQAWATNAMPIKMPDGSSEPDVQSYYVYGPKMVTMYGKFPQDATESRFLTIKTIKHELSELKAKNIPRRWTDDMRAQALFKRNMDMTWRLKNWQPRLQPPDELEDPRVSTRVNQVTVPVKYILTLDKDNSQETKRALEEVSLVVHNLYEDQIFEKTQKTEARIIEAIDAVLHDPAFSLLNFAQDTELEEWGTAKYIRYSDLTKVVNYLIDEMNLGTGKAPIDVIKPSDDEFDDEKPKKGKKKYQATGVTASTIGRKCRELRLPVHRMGRGFVVIIHSDAQPDVVQDRIKLLRMRFGVDDVNFPEPTKAEAFISGEESDIDLPEEPYQEELL